LNHFVSIGLFDENELKTAITLRFEGRTSVLGFNKDKVVFGTHEWDSWHWNSCGNLIAESDLGTAIHGTEGISTLLEG
jgi:hypothetical protein